MTLPEYNSYSRARLYCHRVANGFSLIELLTVIGIMALLAGFAIPAIHSIGGAGDLTGAGYKIQGLFSGARQNSISKNVLTAVIALKSASDESAYRTLVAYELASKPDGTPLASSDWVQVSKWEQLPTGIVIETNSDTSNFLAASPPMDPPLPNISYKGKSYSPGSGYSYQIFMPSGRLKSPPTPCNLNLKAGYYEGGSLKYTGNGQSNYFNLFLVDATGETKVTRP